MAFIPFEEDRTKTDRKKYIEGKDFGFGFGKLAYLNTLQAQADELSQNWAMREQQIEQTNLQMQLMERQQKAQVEQAKVAAQYAQKFLSQWNQAASETRGAFNVAMASVEDTQKYIKSIGEEYGGQINSLIEQTQSDLSQYRDAYSPLEKEAIETSQMALGAQRGMISQFQDLSKADYEGVSGRAKADVGAEMERGRRAESMELSGLGLDPTDSRYRGSMRTSRVDEAINKALAANQARLGEKNRVATMNLSGLQTIDPSKMGGNTAAQIQAGKQDYAKTISGLTTAGAGLKSNMATASTNLAGTSAGLSSSYGQTMMPQYGEAFMSMLGTGMATDPKQVQLQNIGGG